MFESASHFIGQIIMNNEAINSIRPEDVVEEYYTKTGVRVLFLNPSWIFEFNTEWAKNTTFVRWVIIDFIRLFSLLLSFRYTIQFFGHINPYDGGLFQTFYTFTQWYSRALMGILPNIFGMDSSIFFSFYLLDRLDSILVAIIIIDHAGTRF